MVRYGRYQKREHLGVSSPVVQVIKWPLDRQILELFIRELD